MARNTPLPATIRAAALAAYVVAYDADAAAEAPKGYVVAGDVAAAVAKRYGLSRDYVRGLSDAVVYRENGTRNPLADVAPDAPRSVVAKSLGARRRAGGTLARLDTLRATLAATLGVPVSKAETEGYLRSARIVRERDYSGRGTRARATKTRDDAASAAESRRGK